MTYLITFTCYGCHLHGSETGSVDRNHNIPGTPTLKPDPKLQRAERACMDGAPHLLDETRRTAVLQAIREVCIHRGWTLLAAHVRTTHVHSVVEAETPPERVMNAFKGYASRHLNARNLDPPGRKRWTRHGSTLWLRKPQQISASIQYVVAEQGAAMAVFKRTEF